MSKVIPHLVNMEPMSSADPCIFLIDGHVALTKEYLKNQDDRVKLERDFDAGMDFAGDDEGTLAALFVLERAGLIVSGMIK